MLPSVIAVVDDDSGIRQALKNLLATHGFIVELYCSATDFIGHAAVTQAFCLVADIQLDDLSGIEMCRRLRCTGLSIPVVFMTGSLDFGCLAYLTKPFPARALLKAIQTARHGAKAKAT